MTKKTEIPADRRLWRGNAAAGNQTKQVASTGSTAENRLLLSVPPPFAQAAEHRRMPQSGQYVGK